MAKTLNPKAMVEFQNLREVKISPDGQKVVYVLQEYDLDQDRAKTSLWIIRRDRGNAVFRLTNGSNDANPAWSPDSQKIAFTSGREKRAQLYLINVDGGEAEQIKTDVFPASAPQWSPDGKQLAFLAPVEVKADNSRYPGEPEELLPKNQKKQDNKDDSGKKTELPRVITDFNYRADGTGFIYQGYRQLHLLTLSDKRCVQLTDQHERITDFSWNPNGRGLVYTVQQFELQRVRYSTIIRELDVETKTSTKVLEFDGQVGSPSFSPDGRWLLLTGGANDVPYGTAVANIWAVALHGASLPLSTAKVQRVTGELNRSCRQLRCSADGATVYFLKEDAGGNQLHKISVVDGSFGAIEPVKLNGLATVTSFDLSTDHSIAYAADDFVTPPQVYLESQCCSAKLTELNKDYLDGCELCPAEKMHYKGPDDWDVEGWVVKPKG
ncbi:MAG: TolB family protein [Bacillota bacterium]